MIWEWDTILALIVFLLTATYGVLVFKMPQNWVVLILQITMAVLLEIAMLSLWKINAFTQKQQGIKIPHPHFRAFFGQYLEVMLFSFAEMHTHFTTEEKRRTVVRIFLVHHMETECELLARDLDL